MHEETPLVSVITPALDAERYIEATIQSVRSQSYPRIEHIVLTAGSTDRTAEIVASHTPPIRLVRNGAKEQSPKINEGLRVARGPIVGWLNADDLYLPDAVSRAVSELTSNPSLAMVCADYVEIDERGDWIRHMPCPDFDLEALLNVGNLVAQPTVFMRTDAARAVGGVDLAYRYVPDYELWIRMGLRYPVKHVSEYWAAYRRHPDQMTSVHGDGFGAEMRRASRKNGGRFFCELGFTYSRPLRIARRISRGDWRALAAAAQRRLPGPGLVC
jgi:glycosyltransferase involved in cell wall biosynthesis